VYTDPSPSRLHMSTKRDKRSDCVGCVPRQTRQHQNHIINTAMSQNDCPEPHLLMRESRHVLPASVDDAEGEIVQHLDAFLQPPLAPDVEKPLQPPQRITEAVKRDVVRLVERLSERDAGQGRRQAVQVHSKSDFARSVQRHPQAQILPFQTKISDTRIPRPVLSKKKTHKPNTLAP
jgi:hypothetical protein